jgi:hypothetical protein
MRFALILAVALIIASAASSQSVTVAAQRLVAQRVQGGEQYIGGTRARFVDAAIAVGMSCHNLNDEGTAVSCFPPGGAPSSTARFGRKGRIAWFSTDFYTEKMCVAAREYLVSRYGRALHTETVNESDALFTWRYPKRKNRLITYQESPPVEEPMPYGPPRMKQQCHVAYSVGQLVR